MSKIMIKCNGLQKYNPGNLTDFVKFGILETFVFNTAKEGFKYFDLFAGPGLYCFENNQIFRGSPLRVLDVIDFNLELCDYHVFFNEADKNKRDLLVKNTKIYDNVEVSGNWQGSIDEYLKLADENSLFFVDPSETKRYSQKFFDCLKIIFDKGSDALLYVPEFLYVAKHKETVEQVKNVIIDYAKNSVCRDFCLNAGKGNRKRVDHFFAVCKDNSVLEKMNNRGLVKRG